jgi:hypothetical protein
MSLTPTPQIDAERRARERNDLQVWHDFGAYLVPSIYLSAISGVVVPPIFLQGRNDRYYILGGSTSRLKGKRSSGAKAPRFRHGTSCILDATRMWAPRRPSAIIGLHKPTLSNVHLSERCDSPVL